MRILKNLTLVLLISLVTIVICEIVCRAYGLKPYEAAIVKFDYKPGLPADFDSIYGYSLNPGHFTYIKNDTFVYHATHNSSRHRITSIDSSQHSAQKLVILGCSFTYGDGLDDSATHPYILQQLFEKNNRNITVENWGVGGYSPAQFFLQAREIIKDSSVKYVLINYSQVEDERTICSRRWRKAHANLINQVKYQKFVNHPSFSLHSDSLQLRYRSMDYTFLPLQKQLALVELIDNIYCTRENESSPAVSQALLQQTIDTLQKKGIKVILASITGDDESNKVIGAFQKKGYTTLLYGFDICEDGYNLNPVDGHPNYRANKIYAEKAYQAIDRLSGL